MSLLFVPKVELVAQVPPVWSVAELEAEVSVYAASPAFVRANCGPIANMMLDAVDDTWFVRCAELGMLANIDVRVHRLNVGEFPAVPGWHCDGVFRETFHGQPDVDRIRIRDTVVGCVASAADGVSCTEVLTEPVSLDVAVGDVDAPAAGYGVWRDAHRQLEAMVPRPKSRLLAAGEVVCVGERTLHRATPATSRGWRLFFRMSMWHNDYLGDGGMIARQQQVYVVDESNGW